MQNITEDTFDIFLISDTKVDNSFPNSQFSINGYTMLVEAFAYMSKIVLRPSY